MKSRMWLAPCGLALVAGVVMAQAPANPPSPAFAHSNMTDKGVLAMAGNCAPCHGTGGRAAPGTTVPGLAGRESADIRGAMIQFKEGKRSATVMHQIAKGFTDAEIAAMADYFSKQPR